MAEFINTVDIIGDDALTDSIIDRSITEYRDDSLTNIGIYAFNRCSKLTTIDFPSISSMGSSQFSGCSALATIILRNNTLVTLGGVNWLSDTPIRKGTGYIYVPAALVDSYKSATNWSSYAAQIRAIEDYPDVCD